MIIEVQGTLIDFELKDPRCAQVLDWLKEDFVAFARSSRVIAKVIIFIKPKVDKPSFKILLPIPSNLGQCYWTTTGRWIDYGENNSMLLNLKELKATLSFQDVDLLYEVLYNLILSWSGLLNESVGFTRLHGLALSSLAGAQILWGPSGVGKSSLAYLFQKANLPLYSDEISLVHNDRVLPFPVRISLKQETYQALGGDPSGYRVITRKKYPQKILLPFAAVSSTQKIDQIFILQNKSLADFNVCDSNFFKRIYWSWSVFWGLGICQITEFILSVHFLPLLIKMAYRRLKFIKRYAFGSKLKVMEISRSPKNQFDQIKSSVL